MSTKNTHVSKLEKKVHMHNKKNNKKTTKKNKKKTQRQGVLNKPDIR